MDEKIDLKKIFSEKKEKIIITTSYLVVYPLIIYIFVNSFQFTEISIESSTFFVALLIVPLVINSFLYEVEGSLIISFIIVELSFLILVWLKGSFPSWSTGEKITVIISSISYILIGLIIGKYNRQQRLKNKEVRELKDNLIQVKEEIIVKLKDRIKELEEELEKEKQKKGSRK